MYTKLVKIICGLIGHKNQTRITLILIISALGGCKQKDDNIYFVQAEFDEQEYIWLSWVESGFLGGEPFYYTALDAMKEITPFVKVRLFFGPQLDLSKEQLESRIFGKMIENEIDTSRVTLYFNEIRYGAIQDPGPVFLKDSNGNRAVADFKFLHFDERAEAIDRNVAKVFGLPTISSEMISEGGAWQTNGKGTMLLVESVELDRNKTMCKSSIEKEYNRVLGVAKFIWLKHGMLEEEWRKLEDGKYGIGTGGHIDEFCRFVNENTVVLAEVYPSDTIGDIVAKESFRRMEENYSILQSSTTLEGDSLQIIRIPAGPLMTKKLPYKSLSTEEQSWFEDVTTDSVEFYLATGCMNFVIANDVVVAPKFWKEGLHEEIMQRDQKAKSILEMAFPNRKVVQIDCMPLHHDGGGLHCHSKNEPR